MTILLGVVARVLGCALILCRSPLRPPHRRLSESWHQAVRQVLRGHLASASLKPTQTDRSVAGWHAGHEICNPLGVAPPDRALLERAAAPAD